jgi:hypothetical protein
MSDVYEELRAAQAATPAWREQVGSPLMAVDVKKLRDAIIEGLADAMSLPEISTDNERAAHDLLGCPLYTGLLNTLVASRDAPLPIRGAMHRVVVEAVTGASHRLITEGWDCLKRDYGSTHIEEDSYGAQG